MLILFNLKKYTYRMRVKTYLQTITEHKQISKYFDILREKYFNI